MKNLCIIPIYNEEAGLNDLINRIEKVKLIDYQIDFLFINDCSTDSSLKILEQRNKNLINLTKRLGVGHALIAGLKYAINNNYNAVVHLAGNNKMLPDEIINFLNKIYIEKYDFINGSRFLATGFSKNNPPWRIIMIKILTFFVSVLYNVKITDCTCGFRAYKVSIFKDKLVYFDKKKFFTYGFEYYTYGKVLISRNIKSCEIPATMNYTRKKGYSKIIPFIDWVSILNGWIAAYFDRKNIL